MINLKVTHKVILGFAVISLLLFFTSISAIRILGEIKHATNQVADFAIPVQHFSSKVQISLLKQAKLSSGIPLTTDLAKLNSLKQKFNDDNIKLNQQVKEIKNLLSQQKEFKFIKEFDQLYSPYLTSVTTMFTQKTSVLAQYTQLNDMKTQLIARFRSVEDKLVDLSYIEDADNEDLLDKISSASVPIESYVVNMGETINNLVDIESFEEASSVKDTIEVGLNNTTPLFDFLKRLVKGHFSSEKVADISDEFEQLKADLLVADNIFALKIAQLEQIKNLENLLVVSDQQAELSISNIDNIRKAFDNKVSHLQSNIFNDVNQGQTTSWTLLAIILVISAVISYFTVRSMSIPLARINKILSYIAKGDLSRQITVNSDDEYGELSTNVNLVVAHLRSLVGEISSNSHLLNNAAELSSTEIAEVVASIKRQQQTVTEMTTVTTQLNNNANHVLAQAKTAEQQMNDASAQSDDLKAIANETNNHISILVTKLDATSDLMSTLQQQSDNIGGIIETIQSIADQTNLLALNAAIEAARAGESGRGFAVVADEVRLLASRTQESTAEINNTITSLQEQTKKAVLDLSEGKTEATNCKEYTNKLLATLSLINTAIEQMQLMSLNIAESTNEQNSLSNQINDNINDVVALSQSSNDKSLATLSYSEEVAGLAQKLDKSVDQFNI
ncbi:MAG: methyl-accepting chemotaxis protein [Thalassotalea sp.]